jgi:hypothetical protein
MILRSATAFDAPPEERVREPAEVRALHSGALSVWGIRQKPIAALSDPTRPHQRPARIAIAARRGLRRFRGEGPGSSSRDHFRGVVSYADRAALQPNLDQGAHPRAALGVLGLDDRAGEAVADHLVADFAVVPLGHFRLPCDVLKIGHDGRKGKQKIVKYSCFLSTDGWLPPDMGKAA